MNDVFQIEPLTQIDRAQSYIRAYPHILSALKTPYVLDEQAFVCGAHMVYGWMPTILEIHVSESIDVHAGVALLNKARTAGRLSREEIEQLAGLVNRSVVGASKLLHFVNPEAFAIWDSRIYRFLHQKPAHAYRVNNAGEYETYLDLLQRLQQDDRFPELHASVNRKMGYAVSPLRALEVVMFLNSPSEATPPESASHAAEVVAV
ncbi:hypothetical protein OFL57_22465 [Pseudomonas aeruginosa]|uniref:hypothetical protein n=1 Tax=Pseudomonas aeruginosa TaxID=287 RepID=UPI00068B363E|nr:hypothetical protein [Pseudomonas aeruginosa]MCL8375797.1 hypothetical protein [Pseudomonas aeruginosa]MCV6511106.1 hypothetical protein [Pseudomonas aeruginosa]MDE9775572.1 hypothetical protein [Pseudomonas aeruginosa]MDI3890180.1 hypothetical protein [Pseudomonas aeruginosa]RUD39690.1 hypothetical protein IPC1365_30090 [Pseudomonas aeruginosa]